MKTISLAWVIASISTISCSPGGRTIDETLDKSLQWIWEQQSSDGGWHSKTHSVLKDGKVLTPYILYSLLFVPNEVYPVNNAQLEKGLNFLVTQLDMVFNQDSMVLIDYPNYSAAYALRTLHCMNSDTALQRKIATYLIQQQFVEHRGFTPDSLVYGGWGYGEPDLSFGKHGHVDISHTRRVIEALKETNFLTKEITDKANFFIKGVQRDPDDARRYAGCVSRKEIPYDGGFIASVVTISTIKSEPVEIETAGIHYPSYATATCDGLMAMQALGMQETDAYQDAKEWLIKYQDLSTIDGLEDHPEQWDEIMHYYHLTVRSEAMQIIDPDGAWKKKISAIIRSEQQPEGFFINPIGGVNKEDDPLMATILAIQAAGNAIDSKRQ